MAGKRTRSEDVEDPPQLTRNPPPGPSSLQLIKQAIVPEDEKLDLSLIHQKVDMSTIRLPEITPTRSNYDPGAHRSPVNPIGARMAWLNMVRAMLGAGVLALPLAVSQAGIILGVLIGVAMTVLIVHGHLSLLWSLNEISRQLRIPSISYAHGFRVALLRGPPVLRLLGAVGQKVIAIFMILSQLGICTVYVIFTSDNLRYLCDFQSTGTASMCLYVPYLILEYFMRNFKIVTQISLAGSIMTITALIMVVVELTRFRKNEEIILMAKEPVSMMFAVGSFLFNMNAVVVVLNMDRSLKDPSVLVKKYGVIQLGMGVPCLLCTLFGAYGYYTMSNMDENVLRSLPLDQLSTQIVHYLYLIAIALAFPLQYYPITAITSDYFLKYNPSRETLKTILSVQQPLLVSLVFLLCNLLPFQGPFVAFVGNLITSLLTLVFPSLMELSLRYPNHYGKYKKHLIKSIAIIIFGLGSSIFGALLCFSLLYLRYLHLSNIDESEFL